MSEFQKHQDALQELSDGNCGNLTPDMVMSYMIGQGMILSDVTGICGVCGMAPAKVIYKACYSCEEYVINADHG